MIYVNLLGMPKVYKNDETVYFPFKKAEALFYYLIVEKQCTRDSLVHLFWCDVDEQTAKKNLRNALYIIKKTLEIEIFKSGKRSVVEIDFSEISIDLDDNYRNLENGNGIGQFLEGLYVKDAEPFENWVHLMRDTLQDKASEQLQSSLKFAFEQKSWDEAKQICYTLLKMDEFDEVVYRKLMEIYATERKFNKCIEVYQQLSKTLDEELGIEPDNETIDLFEKIMKERTVAKKSTVNMTEHFYFGREQELSELRFEFDSFKNQRETQSLLITGEAGIGKTALVNRFISDINNENTLIIRTSCYQAEEGFYYKPWDDIMRAVSNYYDGIGESIPSAIRKMIGYLFPTFISDEFDLQEYEFEKFDIIKNHVVERAIIDLVERIADQIPIILFVEDIHWIDRMSLALLKSLLMKNKNKNIFMLLTGRKGEYEPIEKIAAEGAQYGTLRRIVLERFNYNETFKFAESYLKDSNFNEHAKSKLFEETEGNPFFMVEMLNHIKGNVAFEGFTPKMQDVLKSRVNILSDSAKKIINIVSVYFDKVTFDNLSELSGLVDYDLSEALEELLNKDMINEIVTDIGAIEYRFTHQKLHDFIYENLSLSKRRILNKRIAESLEKALKNNYQDRLLYSRLVYHFEEAGNKIAAIKYSISNLYDYMQMNYETFPVINSNMETTNIKGYSEEEILSELGYIGKILSELNETNESEYHFRLLKIRYSHMLCRYHIKIGNYEKGLNAAKEMLKLSKEDNHPDYMIKGYLQLIFYAINSHDTKLMQENVKIAIDLAKQEEKKYEIGILLRLKGFQKILTGDFQGGERSLNYAVKVFDSLGNPEKYVLNKAAVYYYLGESHRLRQHFDEAISYYEKAIKMCEEANRVGRLTIFYTNAGHAAYDLGDLQRATGYFDEALKLYDKYDFRWGKSTACAFLSLIKIREGNHEVAEQLIMDADKFAVKLSNPYEMGLIRRVKAEIWRNLRETSKDSRLFKYIEPEVLEMCSSEVNRIDVVDSCYEIDVIRKIEEMCKD